jgi:hypothetical protein
VNKKTHEVFWYYGARWRKGCSPEELGDLYPSSSDAVHDAVASDEFEVAWTVHKIFGQDWKACKKFEGSVIDWLQAHRVPSWLNQHNPRTGEFGSKCLPLSQETRDKIGAANSIALKGRIVDDTVRAKISASMRGKPKKPRTPEHCAKLSAVRIGRKLSKEHCEKLSASRIGKKLSDSHKESLSKAALKWRRTSQAPESPGTAVTRTRP